IIEPMDKDNVPYQILVRGISPELPAYSTVWVCVYVGHRYYPEGPAAVSRVAGRPEWTWQVTVWIGQPEEFGNEFYILAVLADIEATKYFTYYILI
ncbi:MAG: hypothetical protein ACFFC1_16870, partial [Promethearchaeota archaeon]